jgi:hypothetical protein
MSQLDSPEMSKSEVIEMMRQCREDIVCLRAKIAELGPKAHAYDTLTQVLGLLPRQSQAYGVDIVYSLERRLKALGAVPGVVVQDPE